MRLPKSQMIPYLNEAVESLFQKFANSRTLPKSITERARIGFMSAQGMTNSAISAEVTVNLNTIGMWRQRIVNEIAPMLNTVSEHNPHEVNDIGLELLSDKYRSGRSLKFDNVIRNKIKTLACQQPIDYGYEVDHWSYKLLQEVAIKEHLVDSISIGTIAYILETADIKPWRSEYYMNSKEKYENEELYNKKVDKIVETYDLAATIRENKDEVIDHYSKTIRSSGRILLTLVNDVLDFSKIESGKIMIIFRSSA